MNWDKIEREVMSDEEYVKTEVRYLLVHGYGYRTGDPNVKFKVLQGALKKLRSYMVSRCINGVEIDLKLSQIVDTTPSNLSDNYLRFKFTIHTDLGEIFEYVDIAYDTIYRDKLKSL